MENVLCIQELQQSVTTYNPDINPILPKKLLQGYSKTECCSWISERKYWEPHPWPIHFHTTTSVHQYRKQSGVPPGLSAYCHSVPESCTSTRQTEERCRKWSNWIQVRYVVWYLGIGYSLSEKVPSFVRGLYSDVVPYLTHIIVTLYRTLYNGIHMLHSTDYPHTHY